MFLWFQIIFFYVEPGLYEPVFFSLCLVLLPYMLLFMAAIAMQLESFKIFQQEG